MTGLKRVSSVRQVAAVLGVLLIGGCGGGSEEVATAAAVDVTDVGLQGPRAIVYDAAADVYLVSNVSGGGLEEDENGFVSRISPDGAILSLQWMPSPGSPG
jgi:hypothetical protein